MQKHHPETGAPLCGACPEVIAHGDQYVVVYTREPVDADSSVMVHLQHFRSMDDEYIDEDLTLGHSVGLI